MVSSPGRDGLLLCELYVHFSSEGGFVVPHLSCIYRSVNTQLFALMSKRMLGHSSNVEMQLRAT